MSVPNKLTVLRIVLTPVFAVSFAVKLYYLSLLVFFIASLTDWYDGHLARKFGKVTPVGKYLDPLADKLLVSTAFAMFLYLGYMKLWMFALIVSRDFLITALRSYALYIGKPFQTTMFAKWKTAVQMAAIYLVFFWVIAKHQTLGEETTPAVFDNVERWNLIYNLMFFVTVYTVVSGMAYLYENRGRLKDIAIAFYRVFVPTNVR